MKITYISQSVLPSREANGVHVLKMANALSRLNEGKVQLVAKRKMDCHDEVFSWYGLEPSFNLIRLRQLPRLTYLGHAVAAVTISFISGSDLVYSRCLLSAYFALRLRRLVVLELHHLPDRGTRLDSLLHRMAGHSHLVLIVVISDMLRRDLVNAYGLKVDDIVVAHDAADPQPLESPVGTGHDQRIRVGYAGSLHQGKGMEMIDSLSARHPDKEFVVVGGTPSDLDLWRRRMAEHSNVEMVGHVSHADVGRHLRTFDIALLPNRNDVRVAWGAATNIARWTSPLKLFEYMAAGLPVVASRQPNIAEVITHEVDGLLCEVDDVDAWSEAIVRLSDDRQLRERIGAAARMKFMRSFTWEGRARTILEEIGSRLSKRKNTTKRGNDADGVPSQRTARR